MTKAISLGHPMAFERRTKFETCAALVDSFNTEAHKFSRLN